MDEHFGFDAAVGGDIADRDLGQRLFLHQFLERIREHARRVLDFVGLERLSGEFAKNLSGGQQKLLELARVLMAEPKLILLDEPGAGVNPTLLATIMDKLQELHARGITFLIIEHNMDLITQLCNPVLVLAQGRLLMQGTPQAVRSDPRVLEAYLGGETP